MDKSETSVLTTKCIKEKLQLAIVYIKCCAQIASSSSTIIQGIILALNPLSS